MKEVKRPGYDSIRLSLLLASCLFTGQALAQANDTMTPIALPNQSKAAMALACTPKKPPVPVGLTPSQAG